VSKFDHKPSPIAKSVRFKKKASFTIALLALLIQGKWRSYGLGAAFDAHFSGDFISVAA